MTPVFVVRASTEPIISTAHSTWLPRGASQLADMQGRGLRVSFQVVRFELCPPLPFLAAAFFVSVTVAFTALDVVSPIF
jgi:hypothetical protein